MHRARTIEHTRSVRVCWPRMHGACTPQPMTLPGACMPGLRQWSANGPQPSIWPDRCCWPIGFRPDCVLFALRPAELSRLQYIREFRQLGFWDGCMIQIDKVDPTNNKDTRDRLQSGAYADLLYWRRYPPFSNCLRTPPVQDETACTRPYSTPLHTAKLPI